jgi:hypothetical protein
LENHAVTSLPEYTLNLRKLKCIVNAHPMPIRLYQIRTHDPKSTEPDPSCEEVSPQQLAKDIRLLSARLRRMHIHVPPTSFLRQIIVRPVKEDDNLEQVHNTTPTTWQGDADLEVRAAILRQRIEDTYRKMYSDVLDCEPSGVNHAMPHQHMW